MRSATSDAATLLLETYAETISAVSAAMSVGSGASVTIVPSCMRSCMRPCRLLGCRCRPAPKPTGGVADDDQNDDHGRNRVPDAPVFEIHGAVSPAACLDVSREVPGMARPCARGGSCRCLAAKTRSGSRRRLRRSGSKGFAEAAGCEMSNTSRCGRHAAPPMGNRSSMVGLIPPERIGRPPGSRLP
jgi:hypothetical protein